MKKLLLSLAAAGSLSLVGCTSYQITPEAPRGMPLTREGPLPLRVGVVENEKSVKSNWYQTGDLSRKLTDALRYSGLFREVESVPYGEQGRYDLTVTWNMEIKYHVGLFPFLPLCDPLILGCFLDNTDRSDASAEATVNDASGRTLKSYSQSVQATLVYKIGALSKRQKCVESSIENVVANIVTDFIKDRPYYRRLAPSSREEARRPEPPPPPPPAPEAPAESAGWGAKKAAASAGAEASLAVPSASKVPAAAAETSLAAPAAAETPSAASAAPAPAPEAQPAPQAPRHLSPKELRSFDEELLP